MPVFTLYIKRSKLDDMKRGKQVQLLDLVHDAMVRAIVIHESDPKKIDVGGCIVRAQRSVKCVPFRVVISMTIGGPKGYPTRVAHALSREMALEIFRGLTRANMSVEDWSVFCPVYHGGYFSASDFTQDELTRD